MESKQQKPRKKLILRGFAVRTGGYFDKKLKDLPIYRINYGMEYFWQEIYFKIGKYGFGLISPKSKPF